jgi:two-component system, response regulator
MRRLNILHVEDDPEDAELLTRACRAAKLKADFYKVSGGADAMAYLKGEGEFTRSAHPFPDLIILDLKMPEMSGFEFLKWLRRESSLQSPPVLIFTQSEIAEDRAKALAEGAIGYYVKPKDFQSLVAIAESFVVFDHSSE